MSSPIDSIMNLSSSQLTQGTSLVTATVTLKIIDAVFIWLFVASMNYPLWCSSPVSKLILVCPVSLWYGYAEETSIKRNQTGTVGQEDCMQVTKIANPTSNNYRSWLYCGFILHYACLLSLVSVADNFSPSTPIHPFISLRSHMIWILNAETENRKSTTTSKGQKEGIHTTLGIR